MSFSVERCTNISPSSKRSFDDTSNYTPFSWAGYHDAHYAVASTDNDISQHYSPSKKRSSFSRSGSMQAGSTIMSGSLPSFMTVFGEEVKDQPMGGMSLLAQY